QTAIGQNFLALGNICAFETDDERNRQVDFFRSRDNAFGNDVAFHDAAENIDQDTFNSRIGENDLERSGHFFSGCAAAYVEEVCRERAVQFDDVHGRHGKAGTIDHAADIAVQLDIGE